MPIHWLVRRRLGRPLVALFACGMSAATAVGARAPVAVAARTSTAVAARAAKTFPRATGPSTAGKVTFVGPSSFTIQTDGPRAGLIDALTSAANAVTAKDYPYVWGGGHGAAGIASVGLPGPGFNGTRIGYDCSGAVAAVLSAVGLWPAGSGVPNDAGVISALLRRGLIAAGPASAPDGVTLYDRPGVHIFMNINGRFWGTSDGGAGADPRGGAGWLSDGAWDAHSKAFKLYHFLPSVLKDSASYGQDYTFQFVRNPLLMLGLMPGDAVQVAYDPSSVGTMNAMAIDYTGARTVTGTVVGVGLTGTSLTLMGRNGTTTTYQTGGNFELVQHVALGDVVSVAYTTTRAAGVSDGAFIARANRAARPVTIAHTVQVIQAAGAAQASGTVSAIAAGGASFTLHTATGVNQTFATGNSLDETFMTGGSGDVLRGVRVGDAITVSYVQANGGLPIAEQVKIAPRPPPPAPASTTSKGTAPAPASSTGTTSVQAPRP